MVIGFLSLEIYLPYSHSLKDKRQRLSSLINRLKTKYNVAFAELDYQKKWQRTTIGIVTLNNQRRVIEGLFQRILADAERNIDGQIINQQIYYF
jgi:uncharacterized protein YlxP (DUF503 family)